MKYLLLFICLMAAPGARAQHSREEMVRFLTNGEFRTWLYKDYKVTLGASCSGDGQSFDFYKDGRLIWKRCKNGTPLTDTVRWSVVAVPGGPGEFYVKFNHPIEVKPGSQFSSMLLNLPSPEVRTRGKEMEWNSPPADKGLYGLVLNFTSRN